MRGRLWKDGFVGVVVEGVERRSWCVLGGLGGVWWGEDILVSCG